MRPRPLWRVESKWATAYVLASSRNDAARKATDAWTDDGRRPIVRDMRVLKIEKIADEVLS